MQKTKGTFHKYPDDVGSVGTSHLPLARGKRQVWRSSLRDGRRASDRGDDWVPRPAARPGEAKAGPATRSPRTPCSSSPPSPLFSLAGLEFHARVWARRSPASLDLPCPGPAFPSSRPLMGTHIRAGAARGKDLIVTHRFLEKA